MKVTIGLPKPHSKKQELIMYAFSQPQLREMWIACGTKFGKTMACASAICMNAPKTEKANRLWRWVAPRYLQAQIGKKYCERFLPGEPFSKASNSNPCPNIAFPLLNSSIQFFHGGDAQALEGEAVEAYILDEAAKLSESIFESATTTMTVTRGKVLGPSTPLGKNWFWRRCMRAKEIMEHQIKKGEPPTHIFLTAPTATNPFVSKEAIIEAKQRLPDRLFRQYYLAEFLDDGSVFVGTSASVIEPELSFSDSMIQRWVSDKAQEYDVCIGVDWAKKQDWTVFTAWAHIDGKAQVVGFMRMHGFSYKLQLKELSLFWSEFRSLLMVRHDKTGIGEVIDELLSEAPIAHDGIIFTNQSKAYMVTELIMGFEKDGIRIPGWDQALKELGEFEVQVSPLGNMIYSAPDGGTDDVVCSLMLGYTALCEGCQPCEVNAPRSQMIGQGWYADLMASIADEDD